MYKLCLANSVLYSCDHKQGFILYCISTHWTIIRRRDCKENYSEAMRREKRNILVLGHPSHAMELRETFSTKKWWLHYLCISGQPALDKMYKYKKEVEDIRNKWNRCIHKNKTFVWLDQKVIVLFLIMVEYFYSRNYYYSI